MDSKSKKVTIDVLMEGPGGELIFKPVTASPDDIRELVNAAKNPTIKYNLEKEAKEKRVKL